MKETQTIRHRKSKSKAKDHVAKDKEEKPKDSKFGPVPTFPTQRVWVRLVLILGTLVVVYFNSKQEKIVNLAKVKDVLERRTQEVECSKEYFDEIVAFPGCVPFNCGRVVMDKLLTKMEIDKLLDIAVKGFALGGSDGGASILDLHTGALSKGQRFINIYNNPKNKDLFTTEDFAIYNQVRKKIQAAIEYSFKLDPGRIYLTRPTFFSQLTAKKPVTIHDEYWHSHVDKETYESFHYTSLVYLNDYIATFEGGKFIFDDPDNVSSIIEPKRGRVSAFTSGKENVHHVERVTSGTRYAITIAFTCNTSFAIGDPRLIPRN